MISWKNPPLLLGVFLINDTYVRIWIVKISGEKSWLFDITKVTLGMHIPSLISYDTSDKKRIQKNSYDIWSAFENLICKRF